MRDFKRKKLRRKIRKKKKRKRNQFKSQNQTVTTVRLFVTIRKVYD